MIDFLKKFDVFGQGFNLTFMGHRNYKSALSGLVGIILYVIVFYFSYQQITQLITRSSSHNAITFSYLNVNDMTPIPASEMQFLFLFKISLIEKLTNKVQSANDLQSSQFFNIRAIQSKYDSIKQSEAILELQYGRCDEMPESEQHLAFQNIQTGHWKQLMNESFCLNTKGLEFYGNPVSGGGFAF